MKISGMKNKKILFLIHTLGIGGAEKVLVNLANNLAEKGYQITVMTVIDTGAFREYLNKKVIYQTMFRLPFHISGKSKSGSLQGESSLIKKILKRIYMVLEKL